MLWPRWAGHQRLLTCLLWLLATILALLVPFTHGAAKLGERALAPLSDIEMAALLGARELTASVDLNNPSSHLSKILIPRPSDTGNNTDVRNYLISTMKALKWDVEEDAFDADTPYGRKHFVNVIATKDPSATRRLVIAAHFDSKFFPNFPQNQFVGATDSAAPCAFMLDLATVLDPLLDARAQRFEDGEEEDDDVADITLQLIFFDGEEAFKDWTHTDSIYGARHLAEKWDNTYVDPHAKRRLLGPVMTELAGIEHFVLLDLLGSPHPLIRSYFLDTHWLFDALASAEKQLHAAGLLVLEGELAEGARLDSFFLPRTNLMMGGGHIEDDHLPFLQRGVSILHVIASPFPRVWHTLKDDATALDLPTMRRWNAILRVFVAEYLNLRPQPSKRTEPRKVAHIADELIRTV